MILYQIIISGTVVRFRPFTVREERELLIAQQSEDENVVLNTLESIVTSCIYGDAPNLTKANLLYLFSQIRSKSVGEYSEVISTCLHCSEKNDIQLDLTFTSIRGLETKTIDLTESLSVTIREPKAVDYIKHSDELERLIQLLYTVSHAGCTYSNNSHKDISEFLLNRTTEELEKIKTGVNELAVTLLKTEYKCKKCGEINIIEVNDISEWLVICLAHDTLSNHYKSNFELLQTHKYSLSDLDNMYPYEREIYVMLLNKMIREKNEAARQK